MPRKGENIYKRKDGRWEARYIHHYESGKAKYRSVYADTYAEARVRRQEQLSTPENYLAKGSKKLGTYAEIANLWLGEIRMTVKESTYTRYYRIVETYLLPKLGEEKLVKIDLTRMNSLIQEFLTTGGQRRKGLSAKTVGDILCVWKSIWDFGAERGYPCPDLKGLLRPQKSMSKIKILSEDSQKEIEKELLRSGDLTSLGIVFTAFTGIRIGELCGLTWGDLDLKNGVAYIRRTVERIADLDPGQARKTKVIISEPKTENAVRSIPLPRFLTAYLTERKAQNDCYLLTGTPKFIEPHNCYIRYRRFLARNGMEEYSFHALRHTFATRCVEEGFDIKSLSEILGHSNVATTMSFYVHPTMQMKRNQMELLTPEFLLPSESASGGA